MQYGFQNRLGWEGSTKKLQQNLAKLFGIQTQSFQNNILQLYFLNCRVFTTTNYIYIFFFFLLIL